MTDQQPIEVQLVVRIMIKHNKKLLMVRRGKHESRAGFWEFPGGSVEAGETFEQGVVRELAEETGLIVSEDALKYVRSERYTVTNKDIIAAIFEAEVNQTTVTLSDEHDDFTWVDSSNFNNLELEGNYTDALRGLFGTDKVADSVNDNDAINTTKEQSNTRLIVYTDGGSRGNPGPSASGYVIMDEKKRVLQEGGEYLGITTNNQAEYQAVRIALEACIELGARDVDFFIDSQLVVRQMNGEYKIKNRDLWPIHESIKQLAAGIGKVTFTHVYREDNKLADAKVNEVLDNRL